MKNGLMLLVCALTVSATHADDLPKKIDLTQYAQEQVSDAQVGEKTPLERTTQLSENTEKTLAQSKEKQKDKENLADEIAQEIDAREQAAAQEMFAAIEDLSDMQKAGRTAHKMLGLPDDAPLPPSIDLAKYATNATKQTNAAKSRAKTGQDAGGRKSYVVRGKRYYILENTDNFKEVGRASWYGPGFHGRKTASGEIFNMHALTAAHRQLPLGTKIEVTNHANGKKVVVRINDRGPFHGNRVIDLSREAAKQLGVLSKGVADVSIRVLR